MERYEQFEVLLLPSKSGVIKIYIYGFRPHGSWGQVFATLNDVTISVKGYHRKKTIIRSLTRLNESLLKMNEE